MSLLELRGVHARYARLPVLRDVSLAVSDGELVAILGSNGAGKTTLLRTISGTVRTTGEIDFDGDRVFRHTPEGMARRGVAHVPQGRGTLGTLSVLENLRVGAWTQRGASSRDLAHVFELFPQLYERRDERAAALPALDQQMLGVGRALMAKPRLLLLDEPSLGLAPAAAAQVFATLRGLNDRGLAILVAESRAALALAAARHAFVLDAGQVVLAGNADDVRRNETVRRTYLGY